MIEQRFHTPDLAALVVGVPAGDVEVETADGPDSVVTVDGDEKLLAQTIVELRGRELAVDFRGNRTLFGITISIGDFSLGGGRLRVRAQVPHGVDARLTTAAADMRVDGRLGALQAKSASGDLHVSGTIERDASVKTVSGDVRIDRVGGDLRLQTVSADATVGEIGGSVEAKTVSGDLRLGSLREGEATFASVSGDVDVGVAVGSYLDVDAGSVSGDLSSEVPLADAPGGGEGPTVVLRGKTVSGDVRVFRAS